MSNYKLAPKPETVKKLKQEKITKQRKSIGIIAVIAVVLMILILCFTGTLHDGRVALDAKMHHLHSVGQVHSVDQLVSEPKAWTRYGAEQIKTYTDKGQNIVLVSVKFKSQGSAEKAFQKIIKTSNLKKETKHQYAVEAGQIRDVYKRSGRYITVVVGKKKLVEPLV